MSKKKSTQKTNDRSNLTKICAFWGMTIAALAYIFSGLVALLVNVIKSLNGTKIAAMLSHISSIVLLVGNLALIIAIALPAYRFVQGKSRNWKLFYWICLIVFAFGVVLGMLGGIL